MITLLEFIELGFTPEDAIALVTVLTLTAIVIVWKIR